MSYASASVYEFISKQNNDPIVERKVCAISDQEFAIFQSDIDFYNKISPSFAGQRFQIPTPTLCPEERQRRRLLFMNQKKIYKSFCNSCGSRIISRFDPTSEIKVYCNSCWTNEKVDSSDYGIEFDPEKSLREHLHQLVYSTPFQNLIGSFSNLNNNAQYTNYTADIVDSYMVFEGDFLQNSIYGTSIRKSNYLLDCGHGSKSEHCYECIDFNECYNLLYSNNCNSCRNSLLLSGCQNCDHCIGCVNLVGKSYHYLNNPISAEEYQKLKSSFYGEGKSEIIQGFNKLINQEPVAATTNHGNEKCHSSNQCLSSYNCGLSHTIFDCQNGRYSSFMNTAQDFMDVDFYGSNSSLLYESLSVGRYSTNLLFCSTVGKGENLLYCIDVKKSNNCFACVNMKEKQYCIFNKQYTKEEYEIIVAKIIAHMQQTSERGEFFHPSLSPFAYNETVVNEYFPLTRTEALGKGYKWQNNNYDPVIPEGAKVIDRKVTIEEVKEDDIILKAIFVCELSGRPYRIIKQELDFYRKHNLPLPRRHPDIRHEERMKLRPGRTLYLRNCDKTGEEILSIYPPEYPGKVYSEKAYQQEVYG